MCLIIVLAPAITAFAGGRECSLHSAALDAVSLDPAIHRPAIVSLREAGPNGLRALTEAYADRLSARRKAPIPIEPGKPDPQWERLSAALDAVAKAKDAYASQLYWYTDWEKARASAEAMDRPILSLRLMGNLDEEYSCANSRFFRTVLYANEEVARYLRDHFVLHWKSVRPVPRVSIDFGDGRKLERTLTGNSIHYVLDADGRILDVLPGLYGPGAFLLSLHSAEHFAASLACAAPSEREMALRHYHADREARIAGDWGWDLRRAGIRLPPPTEFEAPVESSMAHRAMVRSVTKLAVEKPLLMETVPTAQALQGATDDASWPRIAALHLQDARLDESSLRLMREKSAVMRRFATWTGNSALLSRMADRFMESIALDTVRNEYLYRRAIHEWLAEDGYSPTVEELNARVYAEMFLTPDTDPWLGLLPADVYTALADDGVTQTAGNDRARPRDAAQAASTGAHPVFPEGT